MKSRIKRIFFWFLTTVKSHHFFHFINRKKIVIVMYHGVLKENMPVPCWWQLPFEKFKWQVEHLKEYYTVMPLRDVIQKIRSQEHLPDNVAIITFDDGFKNNYSTAFPLLKQLNLPATIFLVTDFIGTESLLWPDKLFMLFMETKVKKIDLSDFSFGVLDLASIEKKQAAFQAILEGVKSLELDDKNKMISYMINILSAEKDQTAYSDNFKLLSWEEVDLMNESGLIHFGGHTCNHEILSNLNDRVLNDEIRNSCARINKYGQDLLFAYPNGRKQDFDHRAKAILKQLNVLCSLTTVSGLNAYSQDLYELKRIGVGNDTTRDHFKLLCSGTV